MVDCLVEEGLLERREGKDRRAVSLLPGAPFSDGRFCARSAIEGAFPGWKEFGDPARRAGLEAALAVLGRLLGCGR
jgi:hypothetical protein